MTESRLPRLEGVDFFRGVVIVLMALDHARDFFTNIPFDPLDLNQTSPALFFTRWITHLCAPTFFFLTGLSAHLYACRHQPSFGKLSRYLLTRGLWLILLELTAVRFAWLFNLDYKVTFGQVIWALGWSMMVLAGLVWLPSRVTLALGISIVVGHNAWDDVTPDRLGNWGWLWQILHVPGWLEWGHGFRFFVLYPLLPWVGVAAIGYGLGPLFHASPARRRVSMVLLGISSLAAFALLRYENVYGDPVPWSPHGDRWRTLMAFLDCEKYPPSLTFLLVTLGLMFWGLGLSERNWGPGGRPLVVFGRVPMFFYLLHLYVLHGLAVFLSWWHHRDLDWLFQGTAADPFPFPPTPGDGYDLKIVYVLWLGLLLVLYPLCRAYQRLRIRSSWWRYL